MQHTSFATSLGLTQAQAEAMAYDSRTRDGLRSIQKMKYTHEAMADLIIAEPEITHLKIAEVFGKSGPWISIVINSDAFKAYLARRKTDLVDPVLMATTRERFEAVVERSTAILLEKLEQPIDKIADSTVLKAMEIGAKALGVGGNAAPTLPSSDHLTTLAQRLLSLNSPNHRSAYEEIEDAEIREIRPNSNPSLSGEAAQANGGAEG